MSEKQAEYITDAVEMLGAGYDHPSVEIEAPHSVMERRNGKTQEIERAAFVKISTAFKGELKNIDPNSLKVWLFIALSINRHTNQANPGLRAIHEGTGLAINTIRESIGKLENEYALLTFSKGSGKSSNIYEPIAFISANRSVSVGDTQRPSVSVSDSSVSVDDASVSVESSKTCLTRLTRTNHIGADEISKSMSTMSLEWQLAHGMQISQSDLDKATLRKTSTDSFERELSFGPLPWSSDSKWEKLERFVVKVYSADPGVFRDFEAWRKGKGQYKGWTNAKIRTTPQVFIDSALPEFEASKMYEPAYGGSHKL